MSESWASDGPTENVVNAVGQGWHAYSVSAPFGKNPARKPGGWKYVWRLSLGCGHSVLSMSDTFKDRNGVPEPPRVARCPECLRAAQVQ